MKKIIVVSMALLVLLVAVPSANAIDETHSKDFGCDACHAPHTSTALMTAGGGAPLWGFSDPNTFSGTYYDITMSDTATATSLTGSSKICMGCHDGLGNKYGRGSNKSSNAIMAGGLHASSIVDLTKTHPVSITYTTSVTNNGGGGVRFVASPDSEVLDSGSVECGSCHEIHTATGGVRTPPTAATLCLECHLK
jgi:predicted CXXCH cytochrome family protein